MTAATKDRDLQELPGKVRSGPMEAATKVYGGTIACINAAGNITKGATSTALTAIGVFKQSYDNSAGAAGDITADVPRGVYGPFNNSGSADQCLKKHAGANCYIVDDNTVAKTDGSGTRSKAGVIYDVDASNGVWVEFI